MKGKVYWITGLSGSGKSTIGNQLLDRLKKKKSEVVLLDGDQLRSVFGNDLGYSVDDRKKSSYRNAGLCKMLSDQGIDVICCTISMFHEVRSWNRENIDDYVEIYLDVSIEVLISRDQKKLYSGALNGDIENVMGINMPYEAPLHPDFVIINDGTTSIENILENILREI